MEYLRKRECIEETAEARAETVEAEKQGDFTNFTISEASATNLKNKGIKFLFPIQISCFNHIYQGKDLIGRDRTGSGKTLAFSLPILEKLRMKPKRFSRQRGQCPYVLCLVPTRELAIQVTREFERFKNNDQEYRVLSLYGGTDIHAQINSLKNGAEVVIGTPGRIIDLLERKVLYTRKLKHLVLDETDQMLNFGFQEDIEKILRKIKEEFDEHKKLVQKIQFLLFSATIPTWVEKISSKFMKQNFVYIDMIKNSEVKTSKTVEHLAILLGSKEDKIPAIGDMVLYYGGAHSRTIIFTDKKEEANQVMLNGQIKVESQVLHGDIPQKQREITFQSFRKGTLKCLIATNVAARGLDIPEVDLIIQLSPPTDVETYIHRSGRTGRAGKRGVCVTFYTRREQYIIEKIENVAHMKFKRICAPQLGDIMKANARDVAFSLDSVSSDVLAHFDENAKEILEKYPAREAISRAIAIITGYTKNVKQRSLLSSSEGFITYVIEVAYEVQKCSILMDILRKNCDSAIVDSIKGMRVLKNRRGAVFDIKEDSKTIFDKIAETLKAQGIVIYQVKELPEFNENDNYNNTPTVQGNNGYQRNGYGSNGNNSNGYNTKSNFTNGNSQASNQRNGSGAYSNFQRKDNSSHASYPRKGSGSISSVQQNGNDKSSNKDETKLFVSNLTPDTTDQHLKDFVEFKGYHPLDIYVVKNVDKSCKGFGYVKFADERQAKVALNDFSNSSMNGRQLRVAYADKKI